MIRKRFTPEQIISKLRKAEVERCLEVALGDSFDIIPESNIFFKHFIMLFEILHDSQIRWHHFSLLHSSE